MSLKLKMLGLGMIATLAMSAAVAMNATAETGGHFTLGATHTTITGQQVVVIEFIDAEVGIAISCKKATFSGTVSATTVTEITIFPTYSECSSSLGVAHITMDECHYTFTIGKKSTNHNTVHLICPVGHLSQIHQTSAFGTCTYTLKAQTPTGGVAYTTGGTGQTHDITADLTVSGVHAERHGGPCAIVPTTTTKSELKGTMTIQAFDTDGIQVGITATGSEG